MTSIEVMELIITCILSRPYSENKLGKEGILVRDLHGLEFSELSSERKKDINFSPVRFEPGTCRLGAK